MYLRILKKDLRRKRTMNVILLVFIIFASTFIAGSVSNMASVMTALDSFMEKACVPDYWVVTSMKSERERFEDFASENHYTHREQELIQIDPKAIRIGGEEFQYSNTTVISTMGNTTKIFGVDDQEITKVNEGDIYLTGEIFHSTENDFKIGGDITISLNGKTKTFTLAGTTKDAMFGSSMIGMTRFLVSEEDYAYFQDKEACLFYSMCIYTDDSKFMDRLNDLGLNTVFNVDRNGVRSVYIMDMITAGVLLIVSVCLILISMLILRFTIHFTMSEEFREIGVMKAIGIRNTKIRGLYIVKYLAIAVVGAAVGLALSIPFSNMMIGNLSQNMIMSNDRFFGLNIVCALSVAAVVVLFCYFCTRRIKAFSPIDAIRNGENGERYGRKGVIHLNRWKFSAVSFLVVNDILSGIRRFAVMILIFTLGMLLVLIPVNTINTIQSDKLVTCFNMAECDHVVSREMLFHPDSNNKAMLQGNLKEIKEKTAKKGIEADVFEEVMFRATISHNNKKASSLAFQGIGDVTTSQYVYLEGTAPQNRDEVAVSHLIAKKIEVGIGDTVEIKNGEETKQYIVTAINQSMNNMGEGIRYCQDETLDFSYASGSFGTQLTYTDHPDRRELAERKNVLKKLFPDSDVYTAGEYINYMDGDVAGQLQGIKSLILAVVLCINIFMTVLMVKSFLTREKGEIAMLKAIGFGNGSLVAWQTARIGMVLLVSILLGVCLGTPVSEISAGQVFRIMGAQSIKFDIVPLEVYVIYPAIVLFVTVLAGMLASLQVCKIRANETVAMTI